MQAKWEARWRREKARPGWAAGLAGGGGRRRRVCGGRRSAPPPRPAALPVHRKRTHQRDWDLGGLGLRHGRKLSLAEAAEGHAPAGWLRGFPTRMPSPMAPPDPKLAATGCAWRLANARRHAAPSVAGKGPRESGPGPGKARDGRGEAPGRGLQGPLQSYHSSCGADWASDCRGGFCLTGEHRNVGRLPNTAGRLSLSHRSTAPQA